MTHISNGLFTPWMNTGFYDCLWKLDWLEEPVSMVSCWNGDNWLTDSVLVYMSTGDVQCGEVFKDDARLLMWKPLNKANPRHERPGMNQPVFLFTGERLTPEQVKKLYEENK